MENSRASRTTSTYTARLDRTLKALQDRLKQQEAALEKLRASITPIDSERSADPKSQLQQLRTLKATYNPLAPKELYLPPPDSAIPGLLALRSTIKCIKETQSCIAETEADLKRTQQRLVGEQALLQDAKLIQRGLEARLASLREEIEQRTQKSPGHIARDIIREKTKRMAHYDKETGKLVKAFNSFVDEHLASMLAAEELGGPIVGGMLDIEETTLESGFNTQGKASKNKNNSSEDKRQRRIDEIWGLDSTEDGRTKKPPNEKLEAAAEMRELTEQLLNSLVEADGSGPGAYVDLHRESAASRFLVRSKVAQLHPKDARKLRLADFGGELHN